MPRVALKKKDYKVNDLSVYIASKMFQKKLRQEDIANVLGISQSAFSKRMQSGSFHYKDMLIIFHKIGASDEDILRIMKLDQNIGREKK